VLLKLRLTKGDTTESLTSLLPLPNPLITLPSSLRGNGASGPLSGPAVESRGPSGRILTLECASKGWFPYAGYRMWSRFVAGVLIMLMGRGVVEQSQATC